MGYPDPGTIVSVDFGIYHHPGIVTDRLLDGKPMVISNSYRRRGVFEESWDDFTCGRKVLVRRSPDPSQVAAILQRSRSRIGNRWNLLRWNCEHFVAWSYGNHSHSPQLQSLVAGVALVAGTAMIYFRTTRKIPEQTSRAPSR